MIIQCPRCSTRWVVDDPADSDNPIFKCGRCQHVFRRFPGAPLPSERLAATGRSRTERAADADNLEFIFPRPKRSTGAAKAARAGNESGDDQRPPAAQPVDAAPEANGRPHDHLRPDREHHYVDLDEVGAEPGHDHIELDETAGGDEDRDRSATEGDPASWVDDLEADLLAEDTDVDEPGGGPRTLSADEAGDTMESAIGDATSSAPTDSEGDDEMAAAEAACDPDGPEVAETLFPANTGHVLHLEDAMRASRAMDIYRPMGRFLGTTLAITTLLALLVRADPNSAAAWLARVPIVGSTIAGESPLARRVSLRNVSGSYRRLQNARQVFVISGEAVNNSTATLERILVEGTLYGRAGVVQHATVTAGNRTTLKFGELSDKAIDYLQDFDARITLAPGASVPFSIVFRELPPEPREFSSRVRSVRPMARAASPPAPDPGLHPSVG